VVQDANENEESTKIRSGRPTVLMKQTLPRTYVRTHSVTESLLRSPASAGHGACNAPATDGGIYFSSEGGRDK
jgi:hypothetical protein